MLVKKQENRSSSNDLMKSMQRIIEMEENIEITINVIYNQLKK
jgi:hypothetical protein